LEVRSPRCYVCKVKLDPFVIAFKQAANTTKKDTGDH
jgi:hypothetical protein